MSTEQAEFVASVALGGTLLLSGLTKIRNPRVFVSGVLEYGVLPPGLAIPYAWMVPLVEITCGIALVAGIWPTGAGFAAGMLLCSFLIGVSVGLTRGRKVACHCFGRSDERLGRTNLVRLIVLLALAAVVVGRQGGLAPAPLPPESVPALLLALGAVLCLRMGDTIPAVWRIWRMTAVPNPTIYSGRMSLREHPLRMAVPNARGNATPV